MIAEILAIALYTTTLIVLSYIGNSELKANNSSQFKKTAVSLSSLTIMESKKKKKSLGNNSFEMKA